MLASLSKLILSRTARTVRDVAFLTNRPGCYVALILITGLLVLLPAEGGTGNGTLIALKKKSATPGKPAKQIYELSSRQETSECLKASGVSAYVVSARGSNRGLLLRNVEAGFASNVGMSPGDVLLSINNRVVQSGRDADRILESTPSGPARIMFVHPSESGLQLYNAEVNVPKFSASTSPHMASSDTSSGSGNKRTVPESLAGYERFMIELINSDRKKHGSPPLQENAALSELARAYAKDMATRGFFAHLDPDGNNPQARARMAGIKYGIYENIAYQSGFESGYHQIQSMEASMMNEPPNQQNHRSNILDVNHAAVGVGVVRASSNKLIAVQEFCHESP